MAQPERNVTKPEEVLNYYPGVGWQELFPNGRNHSYRPERVKMRHPKESVSAFFWSFEELANPIMR